MRLEIALAIVLELLEKKRVKAPDLAEEFGLCTRTVRRYLDRISTVVPIYTERGKNGGYCIVEGWRPTWYKEGGKNE